MPRVNARPAPTATTTPKPATPRTPAGGPTTTAWASSTGRAAPRPALLPKATLETPGTREIGDAKVAKTIAGVPVQRAKVLEFQGLTGANPLMTKTLDVRFGKVTASQFDALKAEFGGKSQVKFDANREYTAIDFLPPAVQALVNRDVDPGEPVTIKGTKRLNASLGNQGGDIEINSSPNCHGTAWEAMRSFQGGNGTHVSLLYGDAQLADGHYVDPSKFSPLGTAEPGKAPPFLDALKPGDVVAFRQGEYTLLHSAVYVGGGLFFEKPNTESDKYDESPYRLATYDQVLAPIQEFLGEAPTASALRPTGTLSSGIETFGSTDSAKLEAWAAKKGLTVGKPLVTELEVGFGGGIRGSHFNGVETMRVELGADGRGVIR